MRYRNILRFTLRLLRRYVYGEIIVMIAGSDKVKLCRGASRGHGQSAFHEKNTNALLWQRHGNPINSCSKTHRASTGSSATKLSFEAEIEESEKSSGTRSILIIERGRSYNALITADTEPKR